MECHDILMEDTQVADVETKLKEAAAWITASLASGVVYVHCSRGLSRSPAVIMAYLMIYEDVSLAVAYRQVHRKRPSTCKKSFSHLESTILLLALYLFFNLCCDCLSSVFHFAIRF